MRITPKHTLNRKNIVIKKSKSSPDNKINISDKINLAGVIVNTFIAGFTLYALYLTNKSLQISKDSLDFAKKTSKDSDSAAKANFELTKQSVEAAIKLSKYADSNYTVTKRGIESSNKNYEEAYKISEKSFNETVNQFNRSNTPYIQVEDISLSKPETRNPLWITYSITNLTNIPVKIIKQKTLVKVDDKPFATNEIQKVPFSVETNNYLIKDYSILTKTTISEKPITVTDSIYVSREDKYIYLYKDIYYQNLISTKYRHYMFQAKIKYTLNSHLVKNNTYVVFLLNENFDEKSH